MLQGFYVGVDVASKSHVAYSEQGGFAKLANNKREISRFLASLPAGSTIAMESTGGYGLLLAEMACRAGFVVHVLPPGRVRHFCRSSPSRGKTDRIDARDIEAYARAFSGRLKPYQPLPGFERRLRTLVRKKEAIADKLASLRLMLRSLGDSAAEVRATLAGLEKRKRSLEQEIRGMLAQEEDARRLMAIPCVKESLVACVLPALRTIPFEGKYALDSYAGIDLKANESGRFKGRRRISHQGDAHLRRAVYLAGLSGASSKLWRPYYRRLTEEKRLKPVQAVNALGRKILHTVYGVYTSQKPFDPNRVRLDMKA